ncbi:MAG: LCP family protein [Dehalococcoidia bacterium]
MAILVAAGWLSLVIVTRIDKVFLGGQNLPVGGLARIPGVEAGDAPTSRQTFLVMGLDRRAREGSAATRTDTMFVLTIDPQTKTAGIIGIPRDSWVQIPAKDGSGTFEGRINTAYPIGEDQDYPGGGAELAERVAEDTLGIPIDHHIIIDFEGFKTLIDELGGIDVYVEETIDDPYYSETELPGDYHPLHFDIGELHMDGQTALDYSRTRFDSSDLDRIQRQQQIIFAAMDKAVQLDIVRPDKLLDLWGKYEDAFVTDVADARALGFAQLAAQIDPKAIVSLTIGLATTDWTTPDGASVLLIDKDIVQELVYAIFTDRDLQQEAALVEVQNGAGTDGLGGLVVRYLGQFGFSEDVLELSTAASFVPQTEIIDFSGKTYTAQKLATLLKVPDAQVRIAAPEDALLRTGAADIVVILGADAQTLNFTTDTAPSGG